METEADCYDRRYEKSDGEESMDKYCDYPKERVEEIDKCLKYKYPSQKKYIYHDNLELNHNLCKINKNNKKLILEKYDEGKSLWDRYVDNNMANFDGNGKWDEETIEYTCENNEIYSPILTNTEKLYNKLNDWRLISGSKY